MLIWRIQDRSRRIVVGTGTVLGLAMRLALLAALAVGSLQAILYAAAWWNDGMLELELRHILGAHQTRSYMERTMRARVLEETGLDSHVRVEVVCPAAREPGALESIAPTCLLRGHVEYERDVLFVRRRTTLTPSEKVFRDAIPRG